MSVIPDQFPPRCILCQEPSGLRCRRCKARYCGDNCRDNDWPFHRYLCKPLMTQYVDENRPGPTYFRAVFVPATSGPSKLDWVNSSWKRPNGRIAMKEPRHAATARYPSRRTFIFPYYGYRSSNAHQPFNSTLQAWGPPGHLDPQRGDFVVVTFSEPRPGLTIKSGNDTHPFWTDTTPADFRVIVDYMRWSYENSVLVDAAGFLARYPTTCTICQAVKVNRKRSVFGDKLPKLEKVLYNHSETENTLTVGLPATDRLGTPLRFHIRVPNSLWELTSGQEPILNVRPGDNFGTYLNIELPSMDSKEFVGQVLTVNGFCDATVFRTDKKPLLIIHLKAINAFLKSIFETPGVFIKREIPILFKGSTLGAIPLRWFAVADTVAYEKLNTEENFRKF